MSERTQAFVALVWIVGCLGGAVYCGIIGELLLGVALVPAALALPIMLPAMRSSAGSSSEEEEA